jgi:hypothetical protein
MTMAKKLRMGSFPSFARQAFQRSCSHGKAVAGGKALTIAKFVATRMPA